MLGRCPPPLGLVKLYFFHVMQAMQWLTFLVASRECCAVTEECCIAMSLRQGM